MIHKPRSLFPPLEEVREAIPPGRLPYIETAFELERRRLSIGAVRVAVHNLDEANRLGSLDPPLPEALASVLRDMSDIMRGNALLREAQVQSDVEKWETEILRDPIKLNAASLAVFAALDHGRALY